MNDSLKLQFTLLEYWQTGDGSPGQGDLDSIVTTDALDLPVWRGKGVKGRLREAAELAESAGQLTAGTTDALFGKRSSEKTESTPGLLHFSNAEAEQAVRDWAQQNSNDVIGFFGQVAATAIKKGTAKEHTLRKTQVAIPMILEATVSFRPVVHGATAADWQGEWQSIIRKIAPLVRTMGHHRHRGLGRCATAVCPL